MVGGLIVVALGELSLAEGEERGGVVGGDLDGGLQALDALVRRWVRRCRGCSSRRR